MEWMMAHPYLTTLLIYCAIVGVTEMVTNVCKCITSAINFKAADKIASEASAKIARYVDENYAVKEDI